MSSASIINFTDDPAHCRWKLVVHGCVDGYSRMIVYLRCCSNNTAETVLLLFTEAVSTYGFGHINLIFCFSGFPQAKMGSVGRLVNDNKSINDVISCN